VALKKLLWRKYLFVNRVEAETEQTYWNEKRKKHLAHEHSAGVVRDLGVTETNPPSLTVGVAAGRALDTEGNDPEVESPQDLDCAALVPASGEVTVYITLRYNTFETEPYFVDELGTSQNKFVQDSFVLEATTQAPAAPVIELARFRLAAGATQIRNAADPTNPGLNEIDLRQVKHSGKEVLALRDLSDVDPAEADAFNGMENPSASNPIATVSKADSLVAPVRDEVVTARGTEPSLDARLDVMLNDDGSFKGITKITPAVPLTGGGIAGDVPLGIDDATPAARGAMSAADKAKLDGIEPGATADQTAQEILDALMTVDGQGSGLDADLLDGFDATAFAPILHKDRHVAGGPDAFTQTDLLDALVRRLLESGGAQLLLGAIEDGQFLKRSGGSIVGAALAGGGAFSSLKASGLVGDTGVAGSVAIPGTQVSFTLTQTQSILIMVTSGSFFHSANGSQGNAFIRVDGTDYRIGFVFGSDGGSFLAESGQASGFIFLQLGPGTHTAVVFGSGNGNPVILGPIQLLVWANEPI
jgi:hypothetical protein